MKQICSLILALWLSPVTAQELYFPPVQGGEWETTSPEEMGYCQERIDSLYAFLDSNNTRAFILLKDGRIVLEQYFGNHTQNSLWQWASAGKTITSFLTGIAQQEGSLSITDPSSEYLGEGWTSCTPEQEAAITIWHQLTMTSGLDDGVADPYCTLPECLLYLEDAGTRWAYHNGPYTQLDPVLENATGMTLNEYTTERLKNPTGMSGFWAPVDYNNVYFSNARSMARFGLLILNNGNWDGNQIMTDMDYFEEMVNTSQDLNESYGYLWWLNGKPSFMVPGVQFQFPGSLIPNAPDDMISAMGKDGQFLNVVPGENLIWVRMGEAPENALVPYLLNDDIWAYVNQLVCNPDATTEYDRTDTPEVMLGPDGQNIQIRCDQPASELRVYSITGELIREEKVTSTFITVPVPSLSAGIYLVSLRLQNGRPWTGKIVIP